MSKPQQYIDLANKIEKLILDGTLHPGSRLPTHRCFAEEHGVALATATRAYRFLSNKGLIIGEKGRGMFVRHREHPLPRGFEQVTPLGFVDLTLNMPGNSTDSDLLRNALRQLSTKGDLESMLRYQPHGGTIDDRHIIASYAQRFMSSLDPQHLLITSGGQHGLLISLLALFKRGDSIAVDSLTFPGFITASSMLGITLAPFKQFDGVYEINRLEANILKKNIKGIYLIPTVHNPLGYVMPLEERLNIIAVARKYKLVIIEDVAYSFLEPSPPPSFAELAPELTIQVGSFSKNLATGLRVGYIIAPQRFMHLLTSAIKASTWNTPSLLTSIVTNWIVDGSISNIEKARINDGKSKQLTCRSMLVQFNIRSHSNANYVWLQLHNKIRSELIMAELSKKEIIVSTAEPFCTSDAVPQALRIAFGGIQTQVFEEALATIKQTLLNHL